MKISRGAHHLIIGAALAWFTPDIKLFIESIYLRNNGFVHFPPGTLITKLPLIELFDWAKSGSDLSKVVVGYREDGTRGIFSKTDISRGETIFDIDERFVMNYKNIVDCCWTETLLDEDFPHEFLSYKPDLGLALLLMYEQRNPKSFWAPYINSSLNTSPISQEDFIVLSRELYAFVSTKYEDIGWEEFYWAFANVRTRRFSDDLTIMDKARLFMAKDKSRAIFPAVMFPFGDLANHSDSPNAVPRSWKFVALKNIQPMEEITWNYRPFATPREMSRMFGIVSASERVRLLNDKFTS